MQRSEQCWNEGAWHRVCGSWLQSLHKGMQTGTWHSQRRQQRIQDLQQPGRALYSERSHGICSATSLTQQALRRLCSCSRQRMLWPRCTQRRIHRCLHSHLLQPCTAVPQGCAKRLSLAVTWLLHKRAIQRVLDGRLDLGSQRRASSQSIRVAVARDLSQQCRRIKGCRPPDRRRP